LLTLLVVGVVGGVVITVLNVLSGALSEEVFQTLSRREAFARRYRLHRRSLTLAALPGAIGLLSACLGFRGATDGRSDNDQATSVAAIIALVLLLMSLAAMGAWWILTGKLVPEPEDGRTGQRGRSLGSD
jgi:hypothetical protein